MANRLTDAVRKLRGQDLNHFEHQFRDQIDRSSMSLSKILPANDLSPSEQYAQRENEVVLANALEMLPESYQEVLILRHLKGLKFKEIANQLDKSLDGVKNIWVRAIGKLRDELESEQ